MIFVASATDMCDEAKLCHMEIFDIKCKNMRLAMGIEWKSEGLILR